jgi:hypothetical protein
MLFLDIDFDPSSGVMIAVIAGLLGVTLYFKRMKDNASDFYGRKKEGKSDDK